VRKIFFAVSILIGCSVPLAPSRTDDSPDESGRDPAEVGRSQQALVNGRPFRPSAHTVFVLGERLGTGTMLQRDWVLTSKRVVGTAAAASILVRYSEVGRFDTPQSSVVGEAVFPNPDPSSDVALVKVVGGFPSVTAPSLSTDETATFVSPERPARIDGQGGDCAGFGEGILRTSNAQGSIVGETLRLRTVAGATLSLGDLGGPVYGIARASDGLPANLAGMVRDVLCGSDIVGAEPAARFERWVSETIYRDQAPHAMFANIFCNGPRCVQNVPRLTAQEDVTGYFSPCRESIGGLIPAFTYDVEYDLPVAGDTLTIGSRTYSGVGVARDVFEPSAVPILLRKTSPPSTSIGGLVSLKARCPFWPSQSQQVVTPSKVATQSSTDWGGVATRAIDGSTEGNYWSGSVTHTALESRPWWSVDLGYPQEISAIELFPRTDCCTSLFANFDVTACGSTGCQQVAWQQGAGYTRLLYLAKPLVARSIRVRLRDTSSLQLAEARVYTSARGGHRGCFADGLPRDLPVYLGSGFNVETCGERAVAAGYAYFGLQYGSECWVGSTFGRYGMGSGCTMACSSKPAEGCGGVWHNDVWAAKTW